MTAARARTPIAGRRAAGTSDAGRAGGRRRIRTTSVEPAANGPGGATRGSGGCRHGGRSRVRHGLGHEALLCRPVEGRGAWRFGGGRPAARPARPASLREAGDAVNERRTRESRFPPQFARDVRPCSRGGRPHIGNKVIRPSYDRRARHSVAPHSWRKNEVVRHRPRSRPGRGHLGARRRLRQPHRRRRFLRHAAQRAAARRARCAEAGRARRTTGRPDRGRCRRARRGRQALLARPDRRPRRRPRHRRADEPPRLRRGVRQHPHAAAARRRRLLRDPLPAAPLRPEDGAGRCRQPAVRRRRRADAAGPLRAAGRSAAAAARAAAAAAASGARACRPASMPKASSASPR